LLNNYAVKLDSQGRITNYEDLIAQYAGNEDKLTAFKEDAASYEESLNLIEKKEEALLNRHYQI
jgi:hypothetical protein